jgi:hypothetical protein
MKAIIDNEEWTEEEMELCMCCGQALYSNQAGLCGACAECFPEYPHPFEVDKPTDKPGKKKT